MHPVSIGEILLIILIVLVFWGPGRIGGLGKGLGLGIRNFKDSFKRQDPEPPPVAAQPPLAAPPPAPAAAASDPRQAEQRRQ
jgi:sec-independent protein translocase protein TatA